MTSADTRPYRSPFPPSDGGVFGRRYDASGTPQGAEFQVNSYTTFRQYLPAIASDASGNFVVVWDSLNQDGSNLGVFGQRYDTTGDPRGGEFRVNATAYLASGLRRT